MQNIIKISIKSAKDLQTRIKIWWIYLNVVLDLHIVQKVRIACDVNVHAIMFRVVDLGDGPGNILSCQLCGCGLVIALKLLRIRARQTKQWWWLAITVLDGWMDGWYCCCWVIEKGDWLTTRERRIQQVSNRIWQWLHRRCRQWGQAHRCPRRPRR